MIYDVAILGGGAAGLFTGICLDKKLTKIILEKNDKPGIKVLLSGGERANVSNMDIEPERDYFTQNKKFLLSVFSKFTNWDIMSFFSANGINIVEEDRSRLILESGDSKELLACLVKKIQENNCELEVKSDVKKVLKKNSIFEIHLDSGKKIQAKNVVVSTGGKSFFQVGTTGEGYYFAEEFGIDIVQPYRALGGLSTKRDLSEISGVSCDIQVKLFDKNNPKKNIYKEFGPLLFTHFGVSGPIVFNLGNALGEYLNSLHFDELEMEKYILNSMYIEIKFSGENIPKRVIKFFELSDENNHISLDLQNFRSWKEAKATGGGINTNELDNTMQSKKIPGLYFIGEIVDVTGKTGGFNLQWAWSSAYVCAQSIKNMF